MRTVSGFSEGEIYRLTATVEKMSEHPLGKAIVACFGQPVQEVSDFSMVPGEGIIAKAHGRRVAAGNEKLMQRVGTPISGTNEIKDYPDAGSTVVYVAIDGKFAGYVVLSDTLREDSPVMIEKVKSLNITPVLLTGDNPNAAGSIAGKVGITNFKSGCLPEDKLGIIADMQTAGDEVCMIGDGINDAPALKKANVGIAMGGVGSDIAIDVADIALVDDEIKELPHLLELSKKMMRTIKVNMSFSMALNFLAITLAITGLLGPVVGALVHNAGSVAVIINSALLLKWKKL